MRYILPLAILLTACSPTQEEIARKEYDASVEALVDRGQKTVAGFSKYPESAKFRNLKIYNRVDSSGVEVFSGQGDRMKEATLCGEVELKREFEADTGTGYIKFYYINAHSNGLIQLESQYKKYCTIEGSKSGVIIEIKD